MIDLSVLNIGASVQWCILNVDQTTRKRKIASNTQLYPVERVHFNVI